jgi:hypothetical protein
LLDCARARDAIGAAKRESRRFLRVMSRSRSSSRCVRFYQVHRALFAVR